MNIKNPKFIVGILTSMRKYPRLDGNKNNFQQIQRELIRVGGISYVFSPFSMDNSNIEGAIFLPRNNQWVRMTFPYPHVVYNRIPFREEERTEAFLNAISLFQAKQIPYFNSQFFYKDTLFHMLQKESLSFIPETITPDSKLHMMKFVKRHHQVYAKPAGQSKGEGIQELTYFSTQTVLQRKINGEELIVHMDELFPYLTENHYILQRAIRQNTVEGNPYDLRILVHFVHHTFRISGIGIRVRSKDSLTTHIRYGGTIIPSTTIPINNEVIQQIVTTCGQLLQREYGPIYEFSLDIGMEGENYYLFEINSKPMVFDELHIRRNGIQNLIQIFTELTP